MKIKSVTIYRPDGKGYLEIGRCLLDEEGRESDVKVLSIRILFGIITVIFSNGEKVIYGKLPYVITKI